MAFEYETNLDAVIQVLKDKNTTTATPYLSLSLSTGQIDSFNIVNLDPDLVPWRVDRLPAIFVRVSNKEDIFEGVGQTGTGGTRVAKRGVVFYDVIGIAPKYGMHTDPQNLMDDIYRLARNVEAAFRQEFSLSNTALWCNPQRTSFGIAVVDETWTKSFSLELQATYLFK